VQRVQAMVAHWFGPRQKAANSPVVKATRQPGSLTPASPNAAPTGVATAPVHVSSALATASSQPQNTAPPPEPGLSAATGGPKVANVTASPVAAVPTAASVPALAPDAKPAIVDISISCTDLHSGDVVSGTVITSSNVASVEARIKTYSANLNRLGVGRFGLSMRVPAIPFFLHGTYQLQLIARNTAGAVAQEYFPIAVH